MTLQMSFKIDYFAIILMTIVNYNILNLAAWRIIRTKLSSFIERICIHIYTILPRTNKNYFHFIKMFFIKKENEIMKINVYTGLKS